MRNQPKVNWDNIKAVDLSRMNWEDYLELNRQAEEGMIPDELNPAFLFSTEATDLLVLIAQGKLNAQQLATQTLKARGYNASGEWVGF